MSEETAGHRPDLRCSFCEESVHSVGALLIGNTASICDKCIVLSVQVLASRAHTYRVHFEPNKDGG